MTGDKFISMEILIKLKWEKTIGIRYYSDLKNGSFDSENIFIVKMGGIGYLTYPNNFKKTYYFVLRITLYNLEGESGR